MIVQRRQAAQLLITQPDHAALAAEIMCHWTADGFCDSPRRDSILFAIREHDNGWTEVDVAPTVDPESGRILDFINAPDDVRRGVWPRGVARLAPTPYAAALVAEHALHIYRRYRATPAWAPFFVEMQAARDRHLHAAGMAVSLEELLRDYFFLRIGDLASLTFCNGWTDPQSDESGYTVRFDGRRLIVSPDPFEDAAVPISIAAREVPDLAFASPEDAGAVFSAARVVTLSGTATGDSRK